MANSSATVPGGHSLVSACWIASCRLGSNGLPTAVKRTTPNFSSGRSSCFSTMLHADGERIACRRVLERALEVVEHRQDLLQELLAPARRRLVRLLLRALLEVLELGGGAQQAILELALVLFQLLELLDLLLERRLGRGDALASAAERLAGPAFSGCCSGSVFVAHDDRRERNPRAQRLAMRPETSCAVKSTSVMTLE